MCRRCFFVFIEKIQQLKGRFEENTDHSYLDGDKIGQSMTELHSINQEQTQRLIRAAPAKTCALDLVPTRIVKSAVSTLGPV